MGTFALLITSLKVNTPIILILDHLLAIIGGYCIFKLISIVAKTVIGKKALGDGDTFLAMLLGSWLGLSGLSIAVYLSFVLSGIFVSFALAFKKLKFGEYISFGPFLSLSGVLVWMLGNDFWNHKIFFLGNLFT